LPERNLWWRRRRLRSKPKLGEQRGGRLLGGGGFEPAHGSTVELGELKLVARSRRRLEGGLKAAESCGGLGTTSERNLEWLERTPK